MAVDIHETTPRVDLRRDNWLGSKNSHEENGPRNCVLDRNFIRLPALVWGHGCFGQTTWPLPGPLSPRIFWTGQISFGTRFSVFLVHSRFSQQSQSMEYARNLFHMAIWGHTQFSDKTYILGLTVRWYDPPRLITAAGSVAVRSEVAESRTTTQCVSPRNHRFIDIWQSCSYRIFFHLACDLMCSATRTRGPGGLLDSKRHAAPPAGFQ